METRASRRKSAAASTAVKPELNGNGNAKLAARSQDKPAAATTAQLDEEQAADDVFHSYEFGGPVGVTAMMLGFPPLMYYLWICLVFYDGKLQGPKSFAWDDIKNFVHVFYDLAAKHAYPSKRGIEIYGGLIVFQLIIAVVLPGFQQEGLPVPSLRGKRLPYNCNALACWYTTLVAAATVHFSGIFHLGELIDHFGEMMTWAIIIGFSFAAIWYVLGVTMGQPIRMSGNVIYDYFAGAVLNPRIGSIDVKMWCEVRIPWVLLFLISLGGAAKQYDQYGYVSPNQAFMILATGLYINACAKGEELIPQTWDMVYEKFGWLLSFWNLAGVPFTYSYSIIFMATHDPEMYRFPLWGNVLLYATLLTAYYVFDTSMSQKSRFKMQQDGNTRVRKTFPQLPGGTVKNPKFIQTQQGNKLLVDGWWAWARKPNYTADFVQALTWSICAGFVTPIVYYYPVFFFAVLVHRVSRDFERCHRKYGKDWEEYIRQVPYMFIPGVY